MTLREASELKGKIDKLGEAISGAVNKKIDDCSVCYHGHYEVPVFSIFTKPKNETDTLNVRGIRYSMDVDVSVDRRTEVVALIEEAIEATDLDMVDQDDS